VSLAVLSQQVSVARSVVEVRVAVYEMYPAVGFRHFDGRSQFSQIFITQLTARLSPATQHSSAVITFTRRYYDPSWLLVSWLVGWFVR